MKSKVFSSAFSLALLLGGCPKRQRNPVVVYVPGPPLAPAPAPQTETVVVEAPSPEEEPRQEAEPAGPPAPSPPRRRRNNPRTQPPAAAEPAPAPGENPGPPAEVPALAPRDSPEQAAALRRQISGLQQTVEGRMAQRSRVLQSESDQRTLEAARAFLAQSRKALEEGDLQRSLTLVHKADLLVMALEQ